MPNHQKDRINPYESSRDTDRPQSGHAWSPLTSLGWLVGPPALCALMTYFGPKLSYVLGPGPGVFMVELALASVGTLIPSLVWATFLANRLCTGSTIIWVILIGVQAIGIYLVWQAVFISLDGWS